MTPFGVSQALSGMLGGVWELEAFKEFVCKWRKMKFRLQVDSYAKQCQVKWLTCCVCVWDLCVHHWSRQESLFRVTPHSAHSEEDMSATIPAWPLAAFSPIYGTYPLHLNSNNPKPGRSISFFREVKSVERTMTTKTMTYWHCNLSSEQVFVCFSFDGVFVHQGVPSELQSFIFKLKSCMTSFIMS